MKKRILYVEDDAINAFVAIKFLSADFDIVHVSEGEECLERILIESFALVLMDINLGRGKMDGIETMKRIKSLPAYTATPVFAVTSYALPEDRERFLQEGFDDYLAKPIERNTMIARIRQFLG